MFIVHFPEHNLSGNVGTGILKSYELGNSDQAFPTKDVPMVFASFMYEIPNQGLNHNKNDPASLYDS